jgi:potassium efflux system protein
VVCHQLIERWLIQSSRKLFRKQALSRHAQAKTGQQPAQPATDIESGPVEEPEEDLVVLSSESRRLLDTLVAISALAGLWLVWAEVLPALRIFNEFTLWSYASVVNGQATVVPVTLADAGLIVLIGILTLTATRHFPSLLKIVLLQHLNMSPGSRYTVTTLTRYLIGGTGLMVIASILGFSWSQIQWLVAALGVGIGFGLQEIVANFISGLIILFERPIRVGDVVTIGTTDGVVTRIRIRATTIRDFDRKELLVPNKEFISGRLLNWSLSDPVIRLLLPVGIAYGSDVRTAMALMLQAAEENPLVLDDPKPAVTFDSFGDNALLLNLRCFLGAVDDRVPARSALHEAIDRKFRKAGISMAFPQRDVHLDATTPLAIRVVRDKDMVLSAAGPGTGE